MNLITTKIRESLGFTTNVLKEQMNQSKSLQEQSLDFFNEILDLDEIKENIYLNLMSEDQINTLLLGPPATSKTLFAQVIRAKCKDVCFFDASTGSSGAGLIKVLENHKSIKVLIIDEIDKLKRNDQNVLLSLLNDGTLEKSLKEQTIKIGLKGLKVFATSNSSTKLSKALKSRFETYVLPEYSDEDFIKVTQHCLREKLSMQISKHIAEQLIINNMKDVRLAMSIAKKIQRSHREEDVSRIISNKIKYSSEEELDYN